MSPAFVAVALVLAGCALYSLTCGLLAPHALHGSLTAGLGSLLLAVVPPVAFLLIAARGLAPCWRHPLAAAILAAALATVWIAHADGSLRYVRFIYLIDHVVANLSFAHAFARTLQPGAIPLCTRVARRARRGLTPRVVRYTRHVTTVWAGMFAAVAIASVSIYFAEPFEVWTRFVWLSTAPLTIAVFAIEYAIRCLVIPAGERSAAIDTLRAIVTLRPPGASRISSR
ncbi:MAG: hypothetical protein WDN30_13870 [Pararobbsia sp.]